MEYNLLLSAACTSNGSRLLGQFPLGARQSGSDDLVHIVVLVLAQPTAKDNGIILGGQCGVFLV